MFYSCAVGYSLHILSPHRQGEIIRIFLLFLKKIINFILFHCYHGGNKTRTRNPTPHWSQNLRLLVTVQLTKCVSSSNSFAGLVPHLVNNLRIFLLLGQLPRLNSCLPYYLSIARGRNVGIMRFTNLMWNANNLRINFLFIADFLSSSW